MLKDDLEKIIIEWWRVAQFTMLVGYSAKRLEDLAQVIIDRLEIDELRVGGELAKFLYKKYKRKEHEQIKKMAKAIAKAKPIKIKESDK